MVLFEKYKMDESIDITMKEFKEKFPLYKEKGYNGLIDYYDDMGEHETSYADEATYDKWEELMHNINNEDDNDEREKLWLDAEKFFSENYKDYCLEIYNITDSPKRKIIPIYYEGLMFKNKDNKWEMRRKSDNELWLIWE